MTALRLVFMGTPDFSVPALAALIEAGHDVICVYTQPPRKAGRGHRTQPSPVHAFADENDIPVRHPTGLKDEAVQGEFAALNADAGVVAAYGLILPPAILEAPRLGCLNIHASLLPRWRGAAPIQRAIAAGDAETGITIMQMDEGLDTGAMLIREAVPIGPETTASGLHDTLAALGARLIVKALAGLEDGSISAAAQPETGVTYAHKLSRDEGGLDWDRPAIALARQIRAFNPWPGTWFEHDGERVRVLDAETIDDAPSAASGTVLDDRLTIACAEGALRPTRLQRPGRAAMDADAFLRGHGISPGTVLSAAPAVPR